MSAPDPREDILIRPLRADDVDALFEAVSASLPTLSQWLPWAKQGYTRSDSEGWITHCRQSREAGSEYHFGVFDTLSGQLLGGVGINQLCPARRSANLGYWVADEARGGGVAVSAARLAATWAFAHLGLVRIEILVQPENRASLRVAVKLGAVCEGVARNALIVAGTPCEAIVHSLIPDDMANAAMTGDTSRERSADGA
jgi:ribosomal-protein-serine acetyltransferase